MYTRGKARQEALQSNSETEEDLNLNRLALLSCRVTVMKRKVLSARRRLPVHEIAEMSQTDMDSDVTMVAISTSKSRPRQRITKRKSNHVRNIDGEVNLHTDEESVLETGYQLTTSLTQARKAMKSFMDVFMNTITTMQGMLIHLRSA